MKYVLPPLPYAYDAMEPYIDAKTMEIHYTKHHQAYVDNLNKALSEYPALQEQSLADVLQTLDSVPAKIRTAVRNNGGGHYNHSFFWPLMKKGGGGEPKGKVADIIKQFFGSFTAFQDLFNTSAKTVFGSGWAWLCVDSAGKLVIISTPNQDTPLPEHLSPVLGLDVWEHAYYLKYQNRRPDYITAWWHVVNWDQVEENYRAIAE
jgi:Fe-Mn family superoxide dismutase